jgi:predicted DNA-binding transcriptional regulator YafY
MRADRLLSILMLLQARGPMTAAALAQELEVSVRTIYRDMDALSAAGVPVYADRGPGGGFALLDRYRTTLTGLTEAEVRALFMLSVPEPLAQLGVRDELRAALRKLSASLPAGRRPDEELVRQRIHLDSVWWFQGGEPVPHLPTVQQAVWEDRRLCVTVRLPFQTDVERLVEPYGLVAKAGVWYMVNARRGHIRVHRLSHLVDARLTDEPFVRPPDFDLRSFWNEWCTDHEANRPSLLVRVRVSPALLAELPLHFGEPIRATMAAAGAPDEEGWVVLDLPFETIYDARTHILGFGRAVEVLAPLALRRSVIDHATQITRLYASQQAS